jgi:hypothetical protein
VGLVIRFRSDPGRQLAYSVERLNDGLFFDFKSQTFRELTKIDEQDAMTTLPYRGHGVYADEFGTDDVYNYRIRVHDRGESSEIVAELPVGTGGVRTLAEMEEAARMPQPSYRKGKKYFGGREISARFRYTFYGDDGYTVHTATLWEDGTSSCNCSRWTKQLPGRPRTCPHAERALTLTANVDETGTIPTQDAAQPADGRSNTRQRRRIVDTD